MKSDPSAVLLGELAVGLKLTVPATLRVVPANHEPMPYRRAISYLKSGTALALALASRRIEPLEALAEPTGLVRNDPSPDTNPHYMRQMSAFRHGVAGDAPQPLSARTAADLTGCFPPGGPVRLLVVTDGSATGTVGTTGAT